MYLMGVIIYMTLTQKLKTRLSELIEIRGYASGDRFPTEMELCSRFNVSRHTMREAILDLVKEGYLYRVQGKGTFISDLKIQVDAGKKMNFTTIAQDSGVSPSMEYLCVYSLQAGEIRSIARSLSIRKGRIWCVELLRKVNDIPLVYTRAYLPERTFPGLDQKIPPAVSRDLYELLKLEYGLESIEKEPYSLETAMPEYNVMKLLCIPGSIPVFIVKSLSRNNGKTPVDFRISISRGDMVKFNNLTFAYENTPI